MKFFFIINFLFQINLLFWRNSKNVSDNSILVTKKKKFQKVICKSLSSQRRQAELVLFWKHDLFVIILIQSPKFAATKIMHSIIFFLGINHTPIIYKEYNININFILLKIVSSIQPSKNH